MNSSLQILSGYAISNFFKKDIDKFLSYSLKKSIKNSDFQYSLVKSSYIFSTSLTIPIAVKNNGITT